MASITFKNRPTEVLHTYQVWRIGSNVNDKSLNYCHPDKVSSALPNHTNNPYIILNIPQVGGQVPCQLDPQREGTVSGQRKSSRKCLREWRTSWRSSTDHLSGCHQWHCEAAIRPCRGISPRIGKHYWLGSLWLDQFYKSFGLFVPECALSC